MSPRRKAPRSVTVTEYYDLDGVAVIWEPGFLPKVEETGAYLHDLVRFGDVAQKISKAEFEQLVRRR